MDLKKSKCLPKLNIRQKLIFDRLVKYFNSEKIDLLLNILNGKSKISLRIIDWFVTNYTKKNNIIIYNKKQKIVLNKSPTINTVSKTKKTKYKEVDEQFNIYLNYKSQLKAYSKKNFDPFCRRERIDFYYNDNDFIITTIGQLNFFRWAFSNNVINYIDTNIEKIENDMNTNIKRDEPLIKKSKKKNIDLGNNDIDKKRRKRRELSTSANNKLNKHKFSITLEFE